jgi:signal peptidase I
MTAHGQCRLSLGVGVVDVRDLAARRMKAEQRAHFVREIIETVILTVLVFLVVHVAIQTFRVDGPSMQPGLQTNQYLLVNATAYWFGGPQRGDVIVFHDNQSTICGNPGNTDLVKRVVAIPGDTIQITATQVVVDGVTLREPYILAAPGNAQSSEVVPPTKLGANQFFVLGDNRLNSCDSRFPSVGVVPRSAIHGRALLVFWPLGQLHWLPNYSTVFAKVHA